MKRFVTQKFLLGLSDEKLCCLAGSVAVVAGKDDDCGVWGVPDGSLRVRLVVGLERRRVGPVVEAVFDAERLAVADAASELTVGSLGRFRLVQGRLIFVVVVVIVLFGAGLFALIILKRQKNIF